MLEREKDKLVAGFSKKELIAGFRKGDPAVIHAIYELHFVRLCDFCALIVGNNFDAQDIVSDVFARLLTVDRKNKEIGRSFTGLDDIANYLYVAAKNRCLQILERNKNAKEREEIYEKANRKEYVLDDELDFEYHRGVGAKTLLETVYNLNQRSIQVLQKIYFEDMSYDEIAREMSISRSTVSGLRQQGINLLAKMLNREDYVYHLCVLAIITLSVI